SNWVFVSAMRRFDLSTFDSASALRTWAETKMVSIIAMTATAAMMGALPGPLAGLGSERTAVVIFGPGGSGGGVGWTGRAACSSGGGSVAAAEGGTASGNGGGGT